MELALNLAWALASSLLVGVWLLWLSHARPSRRDAVMSAVGLVALVVILLPAISLTDDRLAMQSPAEFEHAFRRDDSAYADLNNPPATVPNLVLFFLAAPLDAPKIRAVAPIQKIGQALESSCITMAVRPPPSFALSLA